MRLILNEDGYVELRQEFKDLVRASFDIMQNELGLNTHQENVELEFVPGGRDNPGAAWINSAHRFPLEIKCSMNLPAAAIIHCLSHEMVHARDLVRGHLLAVPGGTLYCGEFVPKHEAEQLYSMGTVAAKTLPFEKVAYELGPKVAAVVFNKLPTKYLKMLTVGVGLERLYDASAIRSGLVEFSKAA